MSAFFEKCLFLDHSDVLLKTRKKYRLPEKKGKTLVYLCGNSLGLMSVNTEKYILEETNKWKTHAVEGHFLGENNWFNYHEQFDEILAGLTGSEKHEVVAANALTVNMHLLFSTFYKPTKNRYKILIESPSFSSDYYAVSSQIEHWGFDVKKSLIEVKPRTAEHLIRFDDILTTIDAHKDELALVWMGGVNYYTGQVFDMEVIAAKAHQAGALVGFDLAHAIGNVPLELHDWQVDFAAWCSYKYLNSGPGGVAGLFIHENHHTKMPAFRGWWGNDDKVRFKMDKEFVPMKGAKAWQLSNAPILSMAAHKAALEVFGEVDFKLLRQKSIALTGLLMEGIELVIRHFPECGLEIITPRNENERGCQVSVLTHKNGKQLFDFLSANDIVVDLREPNVIRMAPVPMYNTFEDVKKTIEVLMAYFKG